MVVHDGIDSNLGAADPVDEAVGKAAKEKSPSLAAQDGTRHRVSFKLIQSRFKGR